MEELMIIRDFAESVDGRARVKSAIVSWEENDYPEQALFFEIQDVGIDDIDQVDEPSWDAFLTACFPLAAVQGEARVRIEGRPCPMLVEGLRTVHAWWESWGGMPCPAPSIDSLNRGRPQISAAPRRAFSFLSGGVDGFHSLLRNRRLYRPEDPAYIRRVLLIHGFDIGKRAREPEHARFRMALQSLEPLAAEAAVQIVPCRTNLRHLPSRPGFWEHRQVGAALAAVGHAATLGPTFLFIAGTYPVSNPVPAGSHAAVDGLFSSQRLAVIHDGSRFSRLEKVRELASWPAALEVLRVCPGTSGGRANCGICEKCLRTRLELLAAGVENTAAFGPSLMPAELWDEAVAAPIGDRALRYVELLAPLRARGLDELCRVLERKIAAYQKLQPQHA
jgi:hypothetical protein